MTNFMSQSKLDNQSARLVLCVWGDQQGDSLTVGKVYPVIYDSKAESHGYIRVVDDSGEDFLYSNKFFVSAQLLTTKQQQLA
ncbi:MAG: hypothetical protein ACKVZH_03825 [Blastocatellia bacterium]